MSNQTTLAAIMPIAHLNEMIEQGYVVRRKHPTWPSYSILNYTDKAVYEKVWNVVTRQTRGLIVWSHTDDLTHAYVVSRPYAKFFNHNEEHAAEIAPGADVYVMDKMDGSLGILWNSPTGWAVATRGSFTSPQALHATEVLKKYVREGWSPRPDTTYLVEIIYPENRIVLDYGKTDDLFLLGTVDNLTGRAAVASDIVLGFKPWPGKRAKILAHTRNTEDNLAQFLVRKDREGLVLIDHEGRMVKRKQEDYVQKHRLIFGLTERAVWERVMAGESAEDIVQGMPEETHDWVRDVVRGIWQNYWAILATAAADLSDAFEDAALPVGRKEIATVLKKFEADLMVCFGLVDQRSDLRKKILKKLKPEHKPFHASEAVWNEGEAA